MRPHKQLQPLSESARNLLAEYAAANPRPSTWIRKNYPEKFRLAKALGHTQDDIDQHGFLWVCRAAARWDPSRGVKFSTYAYYYLLRAVSDLSDRRATHPPVGATLYSFDDEGYDADEVADRRIDKLTLLGHWNSDEFTSQRKLLTWRQRLIVYLYAVENLSMREIARVFGVSQTRIQQIIDVARQRIAASRFVAVVSTSS